MMKNLKREKHAKISIRYPKLIILLLTFVLAYFIFQGRSLPFVEELLSDMGYFGTFLSGIMFAYGFTAAPATAIFLILGKTQNIFCSAIVGGAGALLGDYIIFRLLRTSFKDEIELLKKNIQKKKVIIKMNKGIRHAISARFRHILLVMVADLVIASPLPDEIGVSMLSLDSKISRKMFAAMSFLMNTLGILIILWIGKAI